MIYCLEKRKINTETKEPAQYDLHKCYPRYITLLVEIHRQLKYARRGILTANGFKIISLYTRIEQIEKLWTPCKEPYLIPQVLSPVSIKYGQKEGSSRASSSA